MSRARYGAVGLTILGLAACEGVKPEAPGTKPMATGDVQAAALATYVKPGNQDQYYLFYSGGHSGQVFVAGVPSMRHIFTIPVFTPVSRRPATASTKSRRRCWAASPGATCITRRSRRRRRLRRALALRQRQREQPHRTDRPARLEDEADPRADPEHDGQPRLVDGHRQHRVRAGGHALLGADPEGT